MHTPIVVMTHRHSALSLRLRTDLIDSELRFKARCASMQSWAAIHGRNGCELDKVEEGLRKIYFDALTAIPYLTGGKSSDQLSAEDTRSLSEQFKRWKAQQAKHKGIAT